jgi:hypothetical protein
MVKGAPLQVDLEILCLTKKFVIGIAYRWSAAVSAMAGFRYRRLVFGVWI